AVRNKEAVIVIYKRVQVPDKGALHTYAVSGDKCIRVIQPDAGLQVGQYIRIFLPYFGFGRNKIAVYQRMLQPGAKAEGGFLYLKAVSAVDAVYILIVIEIISIGRVGLVVFAGSIFF